MNTYSSIMGDIFRMDFADGTTVTGPYSLSHSKQWDEFASSGFANPYRDGESTGLVEIHFADGGYYQGVMKDGVITGQGDYQSAFNEVEPCDKKGWIIFAYDVVMEIAEKMS